MKPRKLNYFLLFVMIFVIGSLNAQNGIADKRNLPSFGIKAGVNISNIYDTKSEDFSNTSKVGFAGGIFLSIPIGTYLGFQPELIYSQKGYKGSGNIVLADYKYTRNVDYLDIPLLLQLKPARSLTIVAGPVFSFLLHKKINFSSGNITIEQQTDIENNNIRKNIFGLTGGLDLKFQPVVISGRVGWDMQHNNGDGTSSDPRFKNVWIQATVGLMF